MYAGVTVATGLLLGLVAAAAALSLPDAAHAPEPAAAWTWPEHVVVDVTVEDADVDVAATAQFIETLGWLLERPASLGEASRVAPSNESAPVPPSDAAVRLIWRGGVHIHSNGQPAAGLSYIDARTVILFPEMLQLRADEAGGDVALLARVVAAHEAGHVVGLAGCPIGDGIDCHSEDKTNIMHAHVARMKDWPDGDGELGPFHWSPEDVAAVRATLR